MKIFFVNRLNICSLNEYIFLKVNNYIISLRLKKYYSLKQHKYTVAGCKMMPELECKYVLLNVNIWSEDRAKRVT